MRKITSLLFILFLFACSKNYNSLPTRVSVPPKIGNAEAYLKDSLSPTEFATLDFTLVRWMRMDSDKRTILRIPFKGKSIASRFILISADSGWHPNNALKISLDLNPVSLNQGIAALAVNGSVTAQFLNGTVKYQSSVNNGFVSALHSNSKAIQADAENMEPMTFNAVKELPDIILTAEGGGNSVDFEMEYDDMLGVGAVYGSTGYGSLSGGGGASAGPDLVTNPATDAQANNPAILLKSYFNCLTSPSGSGAATPASSTASLTLYADLPVPSDPSDLFDYTLTPGHSFIGISQTIGSVTTNEVIGFYPQSGILSTFVTVSSKMVNNAGHAYDASITIPLTATQLANVLSAANKYGNYLYDLDTFNCTDFALGVYDAAMPGSPLTIVPLHIPGSSTDYSNTPNGLYEELQNLKTSGNTSAGAVTVSGSDLFAGGINGPCQ